MKRVSSILLVILLAQPAPAQRGAAPPGGDIDVRRTEASKDSPPVIAWTASAQAPPTPALKYTLLPPDEVLVPGNAAALYRMALLLHQPLDLEQAYPGQGIKEASEYLDMPIGELPVRDARLLLNETVLKHVDWAARRDGLDWGWPLREQGLMALFPELNQVRQLSQLVRLRARIEILEGRHDDAVRSLQSGFALGRDVAEDGVLVNALVGAAITSSMLHQVRELTAAPDGPNLYWALADLRRPMFSVEEAMRQESAVLRSSFPLLLEVRDPSFSPEQWLDAMHELFRYMQMGSDDKSPFGGEANASPYRNRLVAATLTAAALPRAREHLEQRGMTRQQIDVLPPVQAVAIYFVEQARERTDDMEKWFRLPFHLGYPRLVEAVEQFKADEQSDPLNPLTKLTPAVDAVWAALARVDREVAAMQAVEAVRAYAAANGGQLPGSLDQVVETPAPPDPLSGQPFGYTLEGDDRFILTAPAVGEREDRALRYEVTVRAR